MVHVYCGDGKGKTTAAMGLALRMAGRERGVLIAQFLKGEDTGERRALEKLERVVLLPIPERVKFSWRLTPEEWEAERRRCSDTVEQVKARLAAGEFGLVVLDEVCAALNAGLLELGEVLACLDLCRERGTEAVLTGRDPCPGLLERADYVTEMVKLRHPYDRGAAARPGVER